FLREVDVWKRLRHHQILPLIGIYTLADGMTYMISPWMQHSSIMSYLKKHQDVDCMYTAVMGLEYLHTGTAIHDDVGGLANILISESGNACVADFGLLMLGEQTQIKYSLSTSFHRAGNSHWMAPELLAEGSVRTMNTDVFSFG
ncbi:hypothetical protein BOTBODRAFT_71302, partial [Botryobasidium botryosum FD-172 SS1]